jgi:hypothetical protein
MMSWPYTGLSFDGNSMKSEISGLMSMTNGREELPTFQV